MHKNLNKRILRHKRVRARVAGNKTRPRLSVFRSNKHIYLQLIDDAAGKTVLSMSDRHIKNKKAAKSDMAFEIGKSFGGKALELGIKAVVFDRGGYQYKGRIARAAEGAREGGLKF